MGMTRHLLALAALALALLVVPSAASANWLPIEELGTIEPSDQEARTAANDRGDAIVLWRDSRGIQVSVSKRGGPFGAARRVPGSKGGTSAGVDVNEDGRAIIWWREFVPEFRQRVKLVGLKIDGGFGKPRVVTPTSDYLTFDSVIGPGGRFAFLYTAGQRFRPVYARVAPPSGKLGRRITLASGSTRSHDLWYVGNRPMIAYTQASDDYSRLRERQIGSGGTRTIANLPKHASLDLDTASNGAQAALWTSGSTDSSVKRPLVAATRRAGRTFGKGQVLDVRVPPQEYDVAIARSGAASVAWREWNESTTEDGESPTPEYRPGRIITSYRPARGVFGALRGFRPDEESAFVGALSVDVASSGYSVLSFGARRFAGIQGRMYAATSNRGDEHEVTPITDFGDPGGLLTDAHIDERQRTVLGWIADRRVVARRGDFSVSQP